jgi:putative ABC transport system permease protein
MIGIRKVLGASAINVVTLLSRDLLGLLGLSFIIASPIAGLAMHKWLQGYAYHVELSWWIFASAGAGTLIVAFLTVSWQVIKAALSNPTKSLRSE